MIAGLRLPFFSEADPEIGAEGGIDPLGMAPVADRLADEIAPGITARMSRVRYLTAISVASALLESFEDRTAPDGSPPYLVFEWMVVEAFARKGSELPTDGRQIPGIDKARRALLRKERMTSRNYLKTPKVFGFHGVYRTLAQSLRLIDSNGYLQDPGERLARVWEREQGLDGFLGRLRGTAGVELRNRLDEALDRSVRVGRNEIQPTSYLHGELLSMFRPDGAGKLEREEIFTLLLSGDQPIRREVLSLLREYELGLGEADYAEAILPRASRDLSVRLEAIRRFEVFATRLDAAFQRFAFLSTQRGTKPISAKDLGADEIFAGLAAALSDAARQAHQGLEALGNVGVLALFVSRFERFEEAVSPGDLFAALLDHHEQIQRQKPPRGKRSWVQPVDDGFVIRRPYRRWESPGPPEGFLHPYRFFAMLRFLEDLQ